MKLNLFVLPLLFFSFKGTSQNVYQNIPATGVSSMSKWMLQSGTGYAARTAGTHNGTNNPTEKISSPSSVTGSVVANWQRFTGSHNIYGVLNSSSKPLQYVPALNAISFIHTKDSFYISSPGNGKGDVVAMISANDGQSWDSTCIWNDTTKRAVYPQGAIYNPPGNTNFANAYIVGSGATISSSTISGNFYASKAVGPGTYNNAASTVSNATQFFANTASSSIGKHDLSCQSFCITDDGVAKSLALIVNDINTNTNAGYGVTGAMLVQGNYSGGVFNWSSATFTPGLVMRSDGSLQMNNRPIMAWNSSGTVGYIVLFGTLQSATGCNKGWQPVVYKTTNSGATWSQAPGIDFNDSYYNPVKISLKAVSGNTALVTPHFNMKEGIDAIVDYNDNLHIASTLVGTASSQNDSLDFTYRFGSEGYQWPHAPGARPYLYDFVTNGSQWDYTVIDSLSSEVPGIMPNDPGYSENPWDTLDNGKKVSSGARIQLSRTADSKLIVYTYTESDSNFTNYGHKWNILPNIKAKLHLVYSNFLVNDKINITRPAPPSPVNMNVTSKAMFHFASPTTGTVSGNGFMTPLWCTTPNSYATLSLPITVSNSYPSSPFTQKNKNNHWFSMVKLTFTGSQGGHYFAPFGTTTQLRTIENIDNTLSIFPNPTSENLYINSGYAEQKYSIQLTDLTGKVLLKRICVGKEKINLNELSSGIYLVNLYVNDQLISTKKLAVIK